MADPKKLLEPNKNGPNAVATPTLPAKEHPTEEMGLIEKYKFEKDNYINLLNIFRENCLTNDFTSSRRAAMMAVIIPASTNLIFLLMKKAPITKNLLSFSALCACFFNFQSCLNADYRELVKKDTPLGNRARKYLQNISYNDPSIPVFAKETEQAYNTNSPQQIPSEGETKTQKKK